MPRNIRAAVALGGLVLLATALTAAFVVHAPSIPAISATDPNTFEADLVEQGRLLAGVGNCAVCHTSPGGAPYAGGLALPTPFGVIYSSNITPDLQTGIGGWSEAAFVRAMRHGIDRQGRHLYPAFPYDYFTRANDADISAIYAYLMSQAPIAADTPENELAFPFNLRPLLAGWKLLFLEPGVLAEDLSQDEEWNRGRYLVEGLGHCGACHTPRNAFGAAAKTGPEAFAGGLAEGWYVPPLNGTSPAPVAWNVDSLSNYLIDGWDRDHGVAAGPMRPVADDLYGQPEDDVVAMAAYVHSLMGEADDADAEGAKRDSTRASAEALDWGHPDAPRLPDDPLLASGAKVFEAHCSECHKSGAKSAPLALTTVLNAPDASNLVEIVLHGIQPPPTGSPDRSMPSRGLQLTDDDLVALAAFLRDRFTDRPQWTEVRSIVSDRRHAAR